MDESRDQRALAAASTTMAPRPTRAAATAARTVRPLAVEPVDAVIPDGRRLARRMNNRR